MKLVVVFEILTISAVLGSNSCPSGCKCGTSDGSNTVDCSFQRLVTIESELPAETQILDLSHNNMMEIGDSAFCFAGSPVLEKLNVSYNKIGQVHMNGFKCLDGLKILDLSQNVIQYLLPHWFWNLLALKELHLNHNDLYSFRPDGPFFESNSLELLDISYCKLSYINKDAFKQLPNLKHLDVSGNFLYQLNSATIEPLKNLELLQATNNTWTCNGVMKKLARLCTTHGITCNGVCQQKTTATGRKFEKMISKVENTTTTTAFNGFEKAAQPSPQNCTKSDDLESGSFFRVALQPFYFVTVLVAFAVGLTMGLLFGCWMSKSCRSRGYPRERVRKRRGRPLIANCEGLGVSTPVMYRKYEAK